MTEYSCPLRQTNKKRTRACEKSQSRVFIYKFNRLCDFHRACYLICLFNYSYSNHAVDSGNIVNHLL